MLPLRLHLVGIGPYKDEIIDFSSINGDVIAIVGENGSGKTTLVESVFAALYRYLPSRESIYKYATGKAQITFEFRLGNHCYRSVVNIDPKKRETEPWIQVWNGEQYKPYGESDGKNGTFDREVRNLLGTPESVLASVFAAQERQGSFSKLPKAKRKELFINMLGLGKLQAVSDSSSALERDSKTEYDRLFGQVEIQKEIASKRTPVEPLYNELYLVKGQVELMDRSLETVIFEVSRIQSKGDRFDEVSAKWDSIIRGISDAERELSSIDKSLATALAAEKAVPQYSEMARKADSSEEELGKLRTEVGNLSGQKSDFHKRMSTHSQTIKELDGQLRAQQEIIRSSTVKMNRTASDAAIIDTVPCRAEGECASCQFLVNAIQAKETVGNLEVDIIEAQASALAISEQIKSTPKPEGGAIAQIDAQLTNLTPRIRSLEAILSESRTAQAKLVRAEVEAGRVGELRSQYEKIKTNLDGLRTKKDTVSAELDEAKAAQSELVNAEGRLKQTTSSLNVTRDRLNQVTAAIARAESENTMAAQAETALASLLSQLTKLDQDRKSWNLLSKAFGKTGIQSLEIDSAGPAISEIANNLLFSCFGPRFGVRFVTQVLKDDKSGYKDDFDIYVVDSENDREGSIDELSGGEKVIVNEAVSLAIALFNRDRDSLNWSSLWRDEASSAVDDRRAPLYIQMLRKSREQGHFDRLFFIAHQQRVTEAADAKVIVTNGKVSFE